MVVTWFCYFFWFRFPFHTVFSDWPLKGYCWLVVLEKELKFQVIRSLRIRLVVYCYVHWCVRYKWVKWNEMGLQVDLSLPLMHTSEKILALQKFRHSRRESDDFNLNSIDIVFLRNERMLAVLFVIFFSHPLLI